jgi:hypothetical protein
MAVETRMDFIVIPREVFIESGLRERFVLPKHTCPPAVSGLSIQKRGASYDGNLTVS